MPALFRLDNTLESDPAIEHWWGKQVPALAKIARYWFEEMRKCGEDVREILHDDAPTLCVGEYAFAYVNAYSKHVNLGFFNAACLDDPHSLLIGTGKRMRHVKLVPGEDIPAAALRKLIRASYLDIRQSAAAEPL